ncbi:hypothetical protein KIN20_033580 [Parelaphostrongylus tenuis]|uniref:Uncharacterized protein n=1 Tax=Parelaphostrongylus tenuis TaxID=148309 RepID=A0AAD5R8K5_PARTN|nr:hypothetical protein KIN20_033580 [Parelaphostrongylus tenuis]
MDRSDKEGEVPNGCDTRIPRRITRVRPPAGETAEERRHQRASTRSVSYESLCKLSVPTRMSERRNNGSSLCASGGQFLSFTHGKS